MNVAIQKTKAETAFLDAYPRTSGLLPRAAWLDERREAAFSTFAATGLPHRRIEEWKWTDLRRGLDRAYEPLTGEADTDPDRIETLLGESPFEGLERARIVFVDGRYDAGRSDLAGINGIEVASLLDVAADAPDWVQAILGRLYGLDRDPIQALNTAFLRDGALIRVADHVAIERPIELVHASTASGEHMTSLRNIVLVGEGASATLIETYLGGGAGSLTNAVTEAVIGRGGRLDRVKVQEEAREAAHLSNFHAELEAEASLREYTATFGARLSRNQIFVKFRGEGADADVSGAYMLADSQHCDTTLLVNHAVPHCSSRELFKCVLDERAHGVFQGKLIVAPDAQKSDAKQQSHALMLSEGAEFDAKPELEIFADDVACGHGATAGALDETLLFYLMARGIPEPEAKSMLIAAFLDEAAEAIGHEGVREALGALGQSWLGRRGGGVDG